MKKRHSIQKEGIQRLTWLTVITAAIPKLLPSQSARVGERDAQRFQVQISLRRNAGALFPTLAIAAPGAQLDKSASYVFGNEVRAFRVPTTDSTGKIKYFDIVIKLSVGSTGTIASTATVTATASPAPPVTQVIVPGTYKASDNTVCTVTNFTVTTGRVQSHFNCTTPTGYLWEMELATGPIGTGHPYLAQLVTAKVDKLSDAATYTWGRVTTGNGRVAACSYFNDGVVVGAKSNGQQIVLSAFHPNPTSVYLYCGGTLVKQ